MIDSIDLVGARCEARLSPIPSSGLTPPCDRKARGVRTMVCESGIEILPVLPACGYHLRRKKPPTMFEAWG